MLGSWVRTWKIALCLGEVQSPLCHEAGALEHDISDHLDNISSIVTQYWRSRGAGVKLMLQKCVPDRSSDNVIDAHFIAINTSVEVGERGQSHKTVTIQGSEQAIARRVKRLILGLRNQRNSELSTEAHDVMFKFDGWNLYEFFVVQLSPLMGIFMALWWYVYIYIYRSYMSLNHCS